MSSEPQWVQEEEHDPAFWSALAAADAAFAERRALLARQQVQVQLGDIEDDLNALPRLQLVDWLAFKSEMQPGRSRTISVTDLTS